MKPDLAAELALVVQRAENAEAALAYAVSTGDECAIEVEALRSRLAEAEALLREAREKVAYMASGMTHAGWVTLDAQKTLARIDAALTEPPK